MQEMLQKKENSGKIESSKRYDDTLWQKVYESARVSQRFAKKK